MIQQLFLCQQGCRNQEELEMEVSVKKGQTYTGVVERVDFPNKGIVVTEELQEDGSSKKVCCVVKNTLPGQRVTFTVNKLRKHRGGHRYC